MNKYLRLFRLGNGIMGIIAVIIGAFLAVGTDVGNYVTNIVIACLVVIAFIAGGNSLNDYIDRDLDKTAHPDRPVPTGEISPKNALVCGMGGLALACIVSLFMRSAEATGVVIIAAVLMVGYEVGLKQRGFVGNLTIAVLTGMVFLFGGAVTGNIESNVIIALMAMLVSIGREIAKDIEDMESDKGERKTLPMSIGSKKASYLAAVFFIAGPVLSIYPYIIGVFNIFYCLVFLADAMFIYCAWILFTNAHKCEKTAKLAMLVALVAFILGVIQ